MNKFVHYFTVVKKMLSKNLWHQKLNVQLTIDSIEVFMMYYFKLFLGLCHCTYKLLYLLISYKPFQLRRSKRQLDLEDTEAESAPRRPRREARPITSAPTNQLESISCEVHKNNHLIFGFLILKLTKR